jgi:aryl-alcohol dehydrogenase-like predicted oxidoreductase
MTLETRFPKNDWRSLYFGPQNLVPTLERVEKLKKVVPPSMTLPEMALRFILSHPAVTTIIVGMRKLDHVRQNIAMSDAGPLDQDLLDKLKAHRCDRKPQPWSD